MNILFGNSTAIHGGAEEVLIKFMLASRELGYNPVLLVPATGWLTEKCGQEKIEMELMPSLPSPFVGKAWGQFKPWLPNAVKVARIVRRRDISIVHSNTPRVSYHCGLGARLAGIAAITHVHDIVDLPYASRLKGLMLSRVADWTLTVSHSVENAVSGHYPSLRGRISTVYNGWDPSFYANVRQVDLKKMFGFPDNSFVIGNVAAMTSWKGQDLLMDAFAALQKEIPEARLLIVGGAQGRNVQVPYEQSLHRKSEQLGLQNLVVFAGWREDALDIIKSVDVFVHVPTKPDPLPTTLLHASAMERPIIASNIGGIPEIVQDGITGILIRPSRTEELILALRELARDATLCRKLAKAARDRFAAVFTWEQMRDGLGEAYQQCLSRRSNR